MTHRPKPPGVCPFRIHPTGIWLSTCRKAPKPSWWARLWQRSPFAPPKADGVFVDARSRSSDSSLNSRSSGADSPSCCTALLETSNSAPPPGFGQGVFLLEQRGLRCYLLVQDGHLPLHLLRREESGHDIAENLLFGLLVPVPLRPAGGLLAPPRRGYV